LVAALPRQAALFLRGSRQDRSTKIPPFLSSWVLEFFIGGKNSVFKPKTPFPPKKTMSFRVTFVRLSFNVFLFMPVVHEQKT
jgi:hypothetical protein